MLVENDTVMEDLPMNIDNPKEKLIRPLQADDVNDGENVKAKKAKKAYKRLHTDRDGESTMEKEPEDSHKTKMSGSLLFPASGGAKFARRSAKSIRFAFHGCANRPFYHIVVMEKRAPRNAHVIEQLGSYDPMANVHGEKLCAINVERVSHWIGEGAHISTPCAILLGVCGLLPIHPRSYITAWRNRRKQAESTLEEKTDS